MAGTTTNLGLPLTGTGEADKAMLFSTWRQLINGEGADSAFQKIDKKFGELDSGTVKTTRKVNNKPLSTDVSLSASDVGAVPTERTINGKPLTGNISITAADVGADFPNNYLYDGKNLKTVFGTAAAFHTAVAAGDFSQIRVGDYFPITLTGTVHDYAAGTDKALSNAVMNMEVAAINPYWQYGDSGDLSGRKNHVVLCSRDCLPWVLQFRSADTTWQVEDAANPWLGSALYETLNNTENGVLPRVLATELGPYVYAGATNKGMRWLGENKKATEANATGWAWYDRGRLFLPSEREVWGADVWSEHSWGGGGTALQWPIFAGSRRHIIKGLGNGGSRYTWWVESTHSASTAYVCIVSTTGHATRTVASDTWIAAPLCFIFA